MPPSSATTTAVELDAHGTVVVVKRAATPAGGDRIAQEIRVLEAAGHPGVVELLARSDRTGDPAVVTRWVGSHTLETVAPVPISQAAGILVAIADCVADLHDLGIVHGALIAEHVVFSPEGQPVLCGFGRAAFRSPGDATAADTGVEDDVAALGRLVRSMAGDEVDPEPIPQWRGWRRRPRWQGYQRRALLMLADQATHDEPQFRPTARALATAIHDSIPEARLGPVGPSPVIPSGVIETSEPPPLEEQHAPLRPPPEADPLDDDDPVRDGVRIATGPPVTPDPVRPVGSGRSRHIVTVLAGVLGVVLLVYGFGQLRARAPRGQPNRPAATRQPSPPPPVTRRPTPSTRLPVSTSPLVVDRPMHQCTRTPPDAVDLDADGCPEPVQITNAVVQAAGVRYAVGRSGDRVVVGDWHCDGRATPAVLRLGTGDVFVFPRWASRGRQVTVKPTSRVPGATAIRAVDRDSDGCPELRVATKAGRAVIVPVRPDP